jgi:hypothetical protein
VLLGRCLLRVEPVGNRERGVAGGDVAARHWERAIRLDPDCSSAVALLKAYRRSVASGGGGKMAAEVRLAQQHLLATDCLWKLHVTYAESRSL